MTAAKASGWVRGIRRDAVAVYFAARDPRTPPLPRALAWMVAVLAVSPIDLIPDFLPIVGDVTDLLAVALGFVAVMRLLPAPVLESSRARADEHLAQPRTWLATRVLTAVQLLGAAVLCAWVLWR